MVDRLDESGLRALFDVALARYTEDVERLAVLTERLAMAEVKAVLPGAGIVEVHGWVNEDWLRVLRIRPVRSAAEGARRCSICTSGPSRASSKPRGERTICGWAASS